MAQKLFDKASLVTIPSQYKEGKIYNIKPEDQSSAFEFERGSGATRVNEDGLIETFYDEATNLLLQSNQFDTTWEVYDLNSPTNGFAGYDGSNDAWLIRENTDNDEHFIRQSSALTSGIGTFSFFAKKKDYDFIQFSRSGDGSDFANFNINNGTIGNYSGGLIDVNIESKGNGWYRCSVTYSFSTNAFVGISLIRSDVLDRYETYLGNGTNGTYIQDAQLESGYFATPYIETTTEAVTQPNRHDTPRLDYSGTETSLLLEPQRTNLLAYSEYYATGQWNNTDVNLTTNYALSPEGKMNASLWEFSTTNTGARIQYNLIGVTTGATYTQSYYIKSLSGDLTLRIGTSGTNVGEFEDITATSEWQRFDFTGVASHTIEYPRIQNISGTQGAQILVYGAQFEEGSYPTSYIPTNGQPETRLQESCILRNQELSQKNFTFFSDSLGDLTGNSQGYDLKAATDSTKSVAFKFGSCVGIATNGGTVYRCNSDLSEPHKIAISFDYDNDVAKVFINGEQFQSDITDLKDGRYGVSEVHLAEQVHSSKMMYNKVVLFPEALTDDECINLTTI